MNYCEKYLKYKKKYIQLKAHIKIQTGGDKAYIQQINLINLFVDEEMEKYMNPIYGFYMCETNYINNLYKLYESGLIDETYVDKKNVIIDEKDKVVKKGNGRSEVILEKEQQEILRKEVCDGLKVVVDRFLHDLNSNRKKLEEQGLEHMLINVRGVGYRLDHPQE